MIRGFLSKNHCFVSGFCRVGFWGSVNVAGINSVVSGQRVCCTLPARLPNSLASGAMRGSLSLLNEPTVTIDLLSSCKTHASIVSLITVLRRRTQGLWQERLLPQHRHQDSIQSSVSNIRHRFRRSLIANLHDAAACEGRNLQRVYFPLFLRIEYGVFLD
jgi:hypothetical protein